MTEDSSWLTGPEQHAWRSFLRMHDTLMAQLVRELQSESKLSAADYRVLVALTDVPEGRLRFLELAKAAEWEKSRTSHHIARMEKRGLISREECAEDGRGAFVSVTADGREAIAAAAPQHAAAVRRMFVDQVSPDELALLARISDRVLDGLEKGSA